MHGRKMSPPKYGLAPNSDCFDAVNGSQSASQWEGGSFGDLSGSNSVRGQLKTPNSPKQGSNSPKIPQNNNFDTLAEASARLERRGSHLSQANAPSIASTSQTSLNLLPGRMSRTGSMQGVPLTIDTTSALSHRPPSPTIRSYPMTSTASSSSSSSHAHHRQISLTSACLPATASYTPDRMKYAEDTTVSLRNSPNLRSASEFDSPNLSRSSHERVDSVNGRSKRPPRNQWRVMRLFSPTPEEKTADTVSLASESPRIQSRNKLTPSYPSVSSNRSFFGLPHSLIAPFLGPFANVLLPASPVLAKGAVAHPPKKQSLAYRLCSIIYICFSLFFLTSHLLGFDATTSKLGSDSAKRLLARTSASGQPQFAINGWAEGIAKGFREKMPIGGVGGSRWRLGTDEDVDDAPAIGEVPEVPFDLDIAKISQPIVAALTPAAPLKFDQINRKWADATSPNPLISMSHPYRFSKMHSKVTGSTQDEMQPFAFRADSLEGKGDVTACVYSNEAWLHLLPEFTTRWNGPVSLIFETLHSKNSEERKAVLGQIDALRKENSIIRNTVDFHIVSTVPGTILNANRSRERLVTQPVASNYQLNLARFFARTEMVWLVGDARVMPSVGLRRKLAVPSVRKLAMSMGDALVIPTFASIRITNGEGSPVPSLRDLRATLDMDQAPNGGVSPEEYVQIGREYANAHLSTLQMPLDKWPKRKSVLVGLSSLHPPASIMPAGETPPRGPIFGLYDQSWDIYRGPSNWNLWRKGSVDPRLSEQPESGGGAGLGINGGIGGGHVVYKVADYDLHYAPSVVISKDAQPWCTERFSLNKAACVYQMYLTGAELWVLPDEWAFSIESVDGPAKEKLNEADKLRDSISSRLYTKFHAEACMHYGREFLSMSLWEDPRVAHLRTICARVLSTWDLSAKTSKNMK